MLQTSAHRVCCYLFVGLAIVTPLTVYGEIKLAPVVDLNPKHLAPASNNLQEPEPLVVPAQAIPLSDSKSNDAGSSGTVQLSIKPLSRQSSPTGRGTANPAITLVAPFDPTGVRQQSVEPIAEVVTLAPIIKTKAPIRERLLPPMPLEAKQGDVVRPMAPVADLVHRTVFVATTGDRLERTSKRQLPILRRHDRTTKQILAALSDMTRDGLLDGKAEVSATEKTVDSGAHNESRPKLSAFIQLADKDPIAKRNDASLAIQRKQSTISKRPDKAQSPIVVQASQPLVNLVRSDVKVNTETEPDLSRTNGALSITNPIQHEQTESVANRPAIVKLVADPLAKQHATEQQTFDSTEAKRSSIPIVKPAVDTLALQPQADSQDIGTTTQVLARDAVVTFAETTPLLASLQEQSPSASDLPAPNEGSLLTDGEIAEAEEIEAIESDLKPIQSVLAETKPEAGELPKNYAARRFAQAGEVTHRMGHSRAQTESQLMWEAPAVAHRPLYFEDINLERHGYKIPIVQPAVSAAHFFGRVPLLPYLAASERHRKPQYTLGHYRPGDYAPYSLYVPRLKLDGSIAEAVFMTGIMFAFP